MVDLIVTSDSNANIDEVKLLLKHKFKMKYLGELCYFLSIEVIRFLEHNIRNFWTFQKSKNESGLLEKSKILNFV